ncbi:hypothetical protein DICPUDRAFT_98394 [Dictyostelium purpureum]|uniref:Uncharacterized protein n=1 Tax=Dictyostelium purpureum TaxID=5786 RepID=F0ZQ23_DICPU|nr:uncharacterized protein DICPUDRAFT_98394 [Dictyostelium purpureum]EGC33935.1 hypothetical protein DICPUDRAFT_98394 [Dictyostelium purpureum]|eukprot:XP_003289517.1 hypothetical protein DICPUDRAFT_98394 [Dictyostelium purpureum]
MCGKERVWIPNEEKGWIEGDIVKETQEGILIKGDDDKEVIIPKDELRMQNPSIQEGIDDMTGLSHLHEAAVIHNLIKRYEINSIYTYTGSILIAINPYTKLPIYTKEMIESFCDQPVAKLQPHVYSIAEGAYREMLNFQKNQSILVSGESGAGKTETTKFLLQYFAAMGEKGNGVNTSMVSEEDIEEGNSIETQVIKSTPILEAFGNAKTLRNDNSSRFGKFIEIHFDKLKGTIVGAKLETYLLEKSRIVKPQENERSYHIFYQMLAGLSDEQKEMLKITSNPEDFYYLKESGCHSIESVDDGDVFIKTEKALKVVGFNDEELMGVWKVLSAILHISNIEFNPGKEEDSSELIESPSNKNQFGDNYKPLDVACELLGCSPDALKPTFTKRTMKAGNESCILNLTVDQACQARDSLAMFLYSRLFDWIVYRINQSIDKTTKKDYLFIGILDIYGFESFENNSFEQFTINYANEKLQNQFNHQIFKLEQKEYEKEKIDWSYIEFQDNQECIDLIEKKPLGILSILDEESQFPKSTPDTLCTKLYQNHGKTKNFEKPRFSNTHFIIDHYAGKVSYDTNLFLEKNKDFIISEQVSALQSTNKMDGDSKSKTSTGVKSSSTFKFTSVSSQFKESLNSLMTTINSTNPHYIRCIKPNTEKSPQLFDNLMVLHQLRCSGVIEQLRISRSGYPSLLTDEKKGSELLMEKLKIDKNNVQFGVTKLFFRSGVIANLELLRSQTMINSAILIQKIWRGFVQRSLYQSVLQSTIFFQSIIRMFYAKQEYESLLEEDAAIHLQSLLRASIYEKEFSEVINSTVHIQSLLRRLQDAKEFVELCTRMNNVIKIQSRWRGRVARKLFRQMKIDAKSLNNVVAEKEKLVSRLDDIQSKLNSESNMAKQIKEEKEKLENEMGSIQIEKEKLVSDYGNIQMEKEELLLKLKNLEKEYQEYKKKTEILIEQLKNQVISLEQMAENSGSATTHSFGENSSFTSPPISLNESGISQVSSAVDSSIEEENSMNSSIILSPKQHKGERRRDFGDKSPPLISSQEIPSSQRKEDMVPKKDFINLEKEYSILKEKDETHQKYIDSLKNQITQLEDKLKKQTTHPRSLLPGIPSNINESPKPTKLSLKQQQDLNNYNTAVMNVTSPIQVSPVATNVATTTISPLSKDNVKSLSYKDFTNSQEIAAAAAAAALNSQNNNLQISPTNSDASESNKSKVASTISDLVSALNFNNCQLESGKFLIDLMMKADHQVPTYVPSEMGGIPEPAFIVSRCFLKNIYNPDLENRSQELIEMNVNIIIYFCDKVEEIIYRDPKSNCSSLCYWFSNFYVLFNIMEAYSDESMDKIVLSDQEKVYIDKLKTTLQTMIVKAHKNVVKNITDYIQPILHKSLNDTSSEIDFMDPITNYLNQIQISLSLETCELNNNICKLLFEQLFVYINAMIFNEILLRKDLCCLRSSIPIKMNISELEHWVKTHQGKEWSVSVCDKLKLLKEVVYILMIDKTQLQNEELRKEICPTLSIAQLKQLLTMYSPDVDSFEDPIPLEILTTLMDCPDYNPSENILLDLSKIFTLKFINSHQLASSTSSLTDLMTSINLSHLENVQYICDDLVSNIVKKNIEIASNIQKIKK